jgi:hypothetical protein
LMMTAGVVVGLALTTTSSYADTKPAPHGTSVGKLAQKARPGAGSSIASKARAKVVRKASAPKIKIRTAPVRKVARRVAPGRTYRAPKVVRTAPRKVSPVRTYRTPKAVRAAVKRASRAATVRPRISTVQRKSVTRGVPAARKATAPKTRLAQRVAATPTKINKDSSKIIKSVLEKAPTAAKRSPSSKLGNAVQTRPVEAKADVTVLAQPTVEMALTVPVVTADGLSRDAGDPAVVIPEITVSDLPVEASVSPVEVSVPMLIPPLTLPRLDLPPVTLPGSDLPAVVPPPGGLPTVSPPGTDPVTVTRSGIRAAATDQALQADQRVAPVGRTASMGAQQESLPRGSPDEASVTQLTAYTATTLYMRAWAITSIGPPVVALLDDLGQRLRSVPASFGTTATALVLAAAIGAAATGTAGAGSAGPGALAVLSTVLRLPAFRGSGRPAGWLRESAFGRPRQPGFSPD